jgi:hypothetical protein
VHEGVAAEFVRHRGQDRGGRGQVGDVFGVVLDVVVEENSEMIEGTAAAAAAASPTGPGLAAARAPAAMPAVGATTSAVVGGCSN